MKAYKGFNRNLACRGHQFELGGSYDTGADPVVCQSGYHACLNPLDVLAYYPAADGSRYCEVEVADDAATHDEDSKVASRTIKVGVELGLPGLIKAGLEVVWERVRKAKPDHSTAATSGYRSTAAASGYRSTAATSGNQSTAAASGNQSTAATSGDWSTAATSGYHSTAATSGNRSTAAASGNQSTAATSGDWSTAATSGYHSTAATSGYWSTAATSGNQSTAATSGNQSTAATSGNQSTAAVTGPYSVAVAAGLDCSASGAVGCWLMLVERHPLTGAILDAKAVKVDGDEIQPGVLYTLRGGKVVER